MTIKEVIIWNTESIGEHYVKLYNRSGSMTWPSKNTYNLCWKMIHAPETVTKEEMLVAASVLTAYQHLIESLLQKARNSICVALKKHKDGTP